MKNGTQDRRATRLDELTALVHARIPAEQRTLIETFVRGYYGQVDVDDLAERVVKRVAPKAKLERISSAALARPAARPANSALSNLLYERTFGADAMLLHSRAQPSSFGEDNAGEIYLVDYNGTIYRIVSG